MFFSEFLLSPEIASFDMFITPEKPTRFLYSVMTRKIFIRENGTFFEKLEIF